MNQLTNNPPQFVPQKVCLSCDGCCRFKEQDSVWRPKLGQEEMKSARSRKPSLAEEIFAKDLDETNSVKTVKSSHCFKCTFFHEGDNICHVYENRPFECRLYPFLLMKSGIGTVIAVHLSCPYIQDFVDSDEYNQFIKILKEYFEKQDTRDFIKKNPNLIQDYSQHEEEIKYIFPLVL